MQNYKIEITDTFGGDANYSWVESYNIKAKSMLGAIQKVSRLYGGNWRVNYGDNISARYDMQGACICCFIEWVESEG